MSYIEDFFYKFLFYFMSIFFVILFIFILYANFSLPPQKNEYLDFWTPQNSTFINLKYDLQWSTNNDSFSSFIESDEYKNYVILVASLQTGLPIEKIENITWVFDKEDFLKYPFDKHMVYFNKINIKQFVFPVPRPSLQAQNEINREKAILTYVGIIFTKNNSMIFIIYPEKSTYINVPDGYSLYNVEKINSRLNLTYQKEWTYLFVLGYRFSGKLLAIPAAIVLALFFLVHAGSTLLKYKWAIIASLVIGFLFFWLPYRYIDQQERPIFMTIGGLLLSIPIAHFWHVFKKPVLQIRREIEQREITVEQKKYGFSGEEHKRWTYSANRLIVENVGRSVAKNCKGWILIENGKERVCWTAPNERPNATIGVEDEERLDFCAYYRGGPENYTDKDKSIKKVPKIFASDEKELPPLIETATIKSLDGLSECIVLITSDNAEPVKAKVVFEDNQIRVEP